MAAAKKAKIYSFRGLVAAPFTAYKSDGSVNTDAIPQYVNYLTKQGVKGVFVNGTTGEGLSLTVDERKKIAEAWMSAGKNKLESIIIHIGANSLNDAKELAAHAEKLNVSAIASMPPFYFKPPTNDHLVKYIKAIADAAPNTPIMLYHIPSFNGVEVHMSDFFQKARAAIPTFCGAKYTSLDMRDLLACHRLHGGESFKLYNGFDEILLASLSCGVTSFVGATYNFMAPLSQRIINAFEKGDLKSALQYQQQVASIVETISKYGSGQIMSALKSTMNILSPIDFGPPRLPLVPLSPEDEEKLKKDLQSLDAKEWTQTGA